MSFDAILSLMFAFSSLSKLKMLPIFSLHNWYFEQSYFLLNALKVPTRCTLRCTNTLYQHVVPTRCTNTLYQHVVPKRCTNTLYKHVVPTLYQHVVPAAGPLCMIRCRGYSDAILMRWNTIVVSLVNDDHGALWIIGLVQYKCC